MSINAQDKNKTIPLKKIFQNIEKQHHVIFNYIDVEIEKIILLPPKNNLSLNEKIKYLQKKTNLSFDTINNQFITVFDKKKPELIKICGYVFNKNEKTPLENANIHFNNGNNTITDKNGYFELQKQNSNEIAISYIGFATQKIIVKENQFKDCITVYLEQDMAVLENIITNHYLTSGIAKKTDGAFEIKPKKLGILPGLIEADVLQAMQQIPGINSADESVASINVRGGTHDQNLFLWNGIKMYQTGHFFGLISAFNPNLAHTVSIYKNGSSPFYGESVSSVVDISSNSNDFEKNNFSAGINMINADVYSKFKISNNGFIEISARRSITDWVQTPTYKNYFNKAFQNTTIINETNSKNTNYSDDSSFFFYDATLKYSQKIGQKDHLILDFIIINDKINVLQSNSVNNLIQSEKNTLYQNNFGGSLSWKRFWNKTNRSTINIYSSLYELEAQQNKIEANQTVKQENEVLDTGIKIENFHKINSKFSFRNGYQFNEISTINLDEVNNPQFYRKNKNVLRNHAFIMEGKFNDSISRLNINSGLRLNYIEQFNKYIFEPRLQFNYGITSNLNFEILGEVKSQNSFQIIDLQKDYLGIEKRRWILANNTTIPIQRSKQVAVSFSYTKNNWLLSVENFYKKVTGINSSGQGFQNQLEFIKINGEYTVVGTEIVLQKKVNHFISWISYTYNDNNYYFPKFVVPVFSNNFELDHVVSWAGIYEKENLKLALGSKWYSGRPRTSLQSDELDISNPIIDYNSPNENHLKSFLQFNFSTTYKWKDTKETQYRIGFSVLNLLNKKNEINEFYRVNTVLNTSEKVKTFALQRTPNISFRVNF
ncbi:TonB-dependent receptor plug domain-containing protein [Flavobacterium luteum]|uniref:TonB-dependent receptor plug domain-containing protein n=1 Tax=Flavobacterium luteum TaxID=2026654 RepID=UPI001CD93B69|nr:carboxypeptidase-like regulatory domain-containing protein [Flavobacterium luteum]